MKSTDEEVSGEEASGEKVCGSQVDRRIESNSLLACNVKQQKKKQQQQQREIGQENINSGGYHYFNGNQANGKTSGYTMAGISTASFKKSESMHFGVNNNDVQLHSRQMQLQKGPFKKRLLPKFTPLSTTKIEVAGETVPTKDKLANTTKTAATTIVVKTAPVIAAEFPPDLLRSQTSRSGFSSLDTFSSSNPRLARKLVSIDTKKGCCMVPPQFSLKRTFSLQLMEEPLLKTPKSLSSMRGGFPLSNSTLPSFGSSYSRSQVPMTLSVPNKSKPYRSVTTPRRFQGQETGCTSNNKYSSPTMAGLNSTVDIIRITHPYGIKPYVTIKKRPREPIFSPLASFESRTHNPLDKNIARSESSFSENVMKGKIGNNNGGTVPKEAEANGRLELVFDNIIKGKATGKNVTTQPKINKNVIQLKRVFDNTIEGKTTNKSVTAPPKLAKDMARSERDASENTIEARTMKNKVMTKPKLVKAMARSKKDVSENSNKIKNIKNPVTTQPKLAKAMARSKRIKAKIVEKIDVTKPEEVASMMKSSNPFWNPKLFDNSSIAITNRPCRCGSSR